MPLEESRFMSLIWMGCPCSSCPLLGLVCFLAVQPVLCNFFSMERDIPHRDTPATFLFMNFNSTYFNFSTNI